MRRPATSTAATMASNEAQLTHAISAPKAEAVSEADESDSNLLSDNMVAEPNYF